MASTVCSHPWTVSGVHRFRVKGSGFRVKGSGFRVQGLGCHGCLAVVPIHVKHL